MTKRITVVMSDKNVAKARKIQSKMILESNGSVSFSSVVNILMEEGAKRY